MKDLIQIFGNVFLSDDTGVILSLIFLIIIGWHIVWFIKAVVEWFSPLSSYTKEEYWSPWGSAAEALVRNDTICVVDKLTSIENELKILKEKI